MSKTILHTKNLSIGYAKPRQADYVVLSAVEVGIQSGEVVCVLGPNGSGKSTLIRTLSGVQKALSGEVYIQDEILDPRKQKLLAQQLSVVLTDKVDVKNLSVYDLVSMGRYPYTGWLGKTEKEDHFMIKSALEKVHLTEHASRNIQELSDGELQRSMIAKALVQDTPLILLDEPTAHLDLINRVETMQLLRNLAKETGKGILLSTHDLDLALQTADRLWLINKMEGIKVGMPEDLVLNGSFEATFHAKNVRFDAETGGYRIQHSTSLSIRSEGNSNTGFWTKRALEREGILLDSEAKSNIVLKMQEKEPRWTLHTENHTKEYGSLYDLIRELKEIKLAE